ncbi:PAS domain S-box protein [Asticcacaulis sp. BYS171W]|uniref:histidine kinase n=1 Tax=Asticcacaulis aquaticus TaxID=2984212 RepID=A0ABT5HYI2_9CAUL|nr:PAS domain S-box protein [Asticcacaulis aquaticus]
MKVLFEAAPDGFMTLDTGGVISYVNPAAGRLLGYRPEKLHGHGFQALLLSQGFDATGFSRGDLIARHRSGRPVPLDVSVSTHADGAVLILRDAGERQAAEALARAARTRAVAVFDHVPDGLMTLDAHGVIDSFNPACEAMFGYAAAEVIGRHMKTLLPEPYHSGHDGFIRYFEASQAARAATGDAPETPQGRRKDGTTFPMEMSFRQFTLDDAIGFCGIVRDMTASEAEARQREALLARLIDSNTELERFAYVASHDMQEPVRMIANFSQIVREDYAERLDADGRDYLDILAGSAERLQAMIRDLLQYARLGREGLTYGEIDLYDQLGHVRENLGEMIRESGAVVRIEPMPRVHGNAVQLLRLFQNLIANAIKYQPDDNVPYVAVSARDEGPHWRFCVADNGVGIDVAFHEDVFEPFRRLQQWEKVQGSGLGLAICRRIVENHDGRIWLDSAPGDGSRFYFTIAKSLIKPVHSTEAHP